MIMSSRFEWEMRPANAAVAAALARKCGIEPLLAQVFVNRGLSRPEDVQRFLSPGLASLRDPFDLPDMERAVARIRRALDAKEGIGVFGDADVDGITAAAIVYELLTAHGARVVTHLSDRLTDGYGFPASLIAHLTNARIRLLVLVDCGTNQAAEIRQLAAAGIDTVVLDHHIPSPDLAKPAAMVNPYCGDGAGQGLCSAGLALKLAQAMWPGDLGRVDTLIDLAALGTLADYAPLSGDNRVMVTEGIARMRKTHRRGLIRLLEAVKITTPTPDQVLKRLVPRLNASGRLGHPRPVWELLVEPPRKSIETLLEQVNGAHVETRQMSREIILQAHEQANRIHFKGQYVMVVGHRSWHSGLMGPVAAQLTERYERPAIAIAFDEQVGVGSGRCHGAFNLYEALRACEGVLLRYGGHPQACGLTIDKSNLDRFRERINQHAASVWSATQQRAQSRLTVEAVVPLRDVTESVAHALDTLKPFGPGNARPLFQFRDVAPQEDASGKLWLAEQETRVRVKGRTPEWQAGTRYDVVGSLSASDSGVTISVQDTRLAVTSG